MNPIPTSQKAGEMNSGSQDEALGDAREQQSRGSHQ